MKIIGLVGRKQSGKDTVYQMIKEELKSSKVIRLAFADPLKIEVASRCEVSIEEIDREKERYRPILQWWGTEFRRTQDKDYWIKKMQFSIENFRDLGTDVIVITDCRFPNEFELIRKLKGETVKIIRPGLPAGDTHPSEVNVDGCSAMNVISNTGSLDDLRKATREVLSSIGLMIEDSQRALLPSQPSNPVPSELSQVLGALERIEARLNQPAWRTLHPMYGAQAFPQPVCDAPPASR